MKNLITVFLTAALAGLFVSCVPSTPEYRIQQRPQDYARLSDTHKELVSRGKLAKGMSMDAVALSWGSPSSRIEGLKDGRAMDRWDYRGQRPVVTNNFFGGFRGGYYGPYRYSGLGGGFGPDVIYVPYRKASVWFVGGKVDEWQRER